MTSLTKTSVIERTQANARLNAAAPPAMMRDLRDASAEEMMAPLDERIIDSTVDALEAGQTHYVDVAGIAPLRDALVAYLNTTTGSQFAANHVLVAAGVQEARFLTLQMVGAQFGRVGIPAIVHPGVQQALGVRKLQIDTLAADFSNRGLPTIDNIEAVLKAGCPLLFLESPSRLTGAAYSAEEVAQIAGLVDQYNAAILWDQGLSAWVDGDYASVAAHAGLAERTAVIGEAWPGMGLASWFVGYIAAPDAWRASMQSQKQIMAICTSTPTQFAALEASTLYAEKHSRQLQQLAEQQVRLRALAQDAGLTPVDGDAVNVLAVQVPEQRRATVMQTLADGGYNVADGTDFGAPGVLRFSLTSTAAATEALQTLG